MSVGERERLRAYSTTSLSLVAHSSTPIDGRSCGLRPGDPNCTSSAAPINWTDRAPDAAAIAHTNNISRTENPLTFVATGREPIRRMQFGIASNAYVNGPSGLIRTPSIGTNVKIWGTVTDATTSGNVNLIDMARVIKRSNNSPIRFKFCCIDRAALQVAAGDSGAFVAYEGTGSRHVAGVLFAGDVDVNGQPVVGAWFTKSFDIQTAFINAGKGFQYYWGTASGQQLPARTTCDPPGC